MELLSQSRTAPLPDGNDRRNVVEYLTLLEGRAAKVDELEKENALLRTKLHAVIQKNAHSSTKHGIERDSSKSPSTSAKRLKSSQPRSRGAFESVEYLVLHNPELESIIRSQKLQYRKLQEAHEILLEKLRESHAVVSCLKAAPNLSNGGQGLRISPRRYSFRPPPTTIHKTFPELGFATPSKSTIERSYGALPTRGEFRVHTVSSAATRREPSGTARSSSAHSSTSDLSWQSSVRKRRRGNPKSGSLAIELRDAAKYPDRPAPHATRKEPRESLLPGMDPCSEDAAKNLVANGHISCSSPYQSTSRGSSLVEIEGRSGFGDDCASHPHERSTSFHEALSSKDPGGLSKMPDKHQDQESGQLTESITAGMERPRHRAAYNEQTSYDLTGTKDNPSRIKEPKKHAKHQPTLSANAASTTAGPVMANDLQADNGCGRVAAEVCTKRESSQEANEPHMEDAVNSLSMAKSVCDNRPNQPRTLYSPRAADLLHIFPNDDHDPKATMPLHVDSDMQAQGIEQKSIAERMEKTCDRRFNIDQIVGKEANSVSCKSAQNNGYRSLAKHAMPDTSDFNFQAMQHSVNSRLLTDGDGLLPEKYSERERHLSVGHLKHPRKTKQPSSSREGPVKLQVASTGLINGVRRENKVNNRAPSPPGFWRTDMPSTQENATSRKTGIQQS
ncbi:hypothetical protein MMC10_000067 [Thelotrema lepadinum]|nr:hypothetical protein [Thelotrema lepadinum]